MKKLFILIVTIGILFSLCACGKTNDISSLAQGIKHAADQYIHTNFAAEIHNIRILETAPRSCKVELSFSRENLTYIDNIVAEIYLSQDSESKEWFVSPNSFKEKSREIDFSPLNGKWNAIYYHGSNYLTKDKIPYTFNFSKAGTISGKGNTFSVGSINVDHELNDIWTEYLNPNPDLTKGMSGPMSYETGKMDIRYAGIGTSIFYEKTPKFTITFSETTNSSFFKSDCVIEIYADKIVFSDGHGARDTKLSK